ncbi:MerR family transcriptional regulator [Agrococcus carbonis]|uniref:DNA-binding transcriptional regulator, MerR family n=1 Tax=Agrococcus carbonis TaxID=684552 RepID=A0A1H1PQF9_9MICO|nr:MerR family transcriptional regulator [Agrococcus carbonis]SDS13541.1 DNA-binding transcriptional regulator, MerR family [Agrococcus carbonis]
MKSSAVLAQWTIGELAERFELATHVLRHWESEGLLAPVRDAGGRRRYGEADAYRVATILASKAAGMSLEQVRAMLDGASRERHRVLDAHLADIDASIAALERSRAMALHALECRAHDVATCPSFRAHVADIVAGERRGMPLHRGEHAEAAPHAG